jgi:hypothetical protein
MRRSAELAPQHRVPSADTRGGGQAPDRVLRLTIGRTFANRKHGLPDDSPEAWDEHRRRADALHAELASSGPWRVASWGDTDDQVRTHEFVEIVLEVAAAAGPYVALQFANHVITLVANELVAPLKELISRTARRVRSGDLGSVAITLPDDTNITLNQAAASGHVLVRAISTLSLDPGGAVDPATSPGASEAAGTPARTAEEDTRHARPYSPRIGYVLALAYVALVALLVGLRSVLDEDVQDLPWLLLIGLVVVLPAAIPFLAAAIREMRPSLTAVKLGSLLELRFTELHAQAAGLGRIEEILPAAETGANLATGAPSMEETVASLRASRAEVLRIDLAAGRKWRMRNLFLLARAVAADTAVRQIVFVRDVDGSDVSFVGSCSPVTLQEKFQRLPGYPEAARQLAQANGMVAQLGVLDAALAGPESAGQVPIHAHRQSLELVLGEDLETGSVEEPLEMNPAEYCRLLRRRERFIAVTQHGAYRYSLSQDRIVNVVSRALAVEALQRAEETSHAGWRANSA